MGIGKSKQTPDKVSNKYSWFGLLEMVSKSSLLIPNEYRVKSPPLGRGPFGELREALNIKLN